MKQIEVSCCLGKSFGYQKKTPNTNMKNIAVQFGIFLEARSTEAKSEKVHLQALALCSRSGELHGLKSSADIQDYLLLDWCR